VLANIAPMIPVAARPALCNLRLLLAGAAPAAQPVVARPAKRA
jgi:hypothetical protein